MHTPTTFKQTHPYIHASPFSVILCKKPVQIIRLQRDGNFHDVDWLPAPPRLPVHFTLMYFYSIHRLWRLVFEIQFYLPAFFLFSLSLLILDVFFFTSLFFHLSFSFPIFTYLYIFFFYLLIFNLFYSFFFFFGF